MEMIKLMGVSMERRPHASLQWKGTDACMDVYCECGANGHIDADFTYYLKCSACGKVYEADPSITLKPLDREPENCVVVFAEDKRPQHEPPPPEGPPNRIISDHGRVRPKK